MRKLLLCALIGFASLSLCAQTKPAAHKPAAKAASPSPNTKAACLTISCDLECSLSVDGGAPVHTDAAGAAKIPVDLGEHKLVASSADGKDKQEQVVAVAIAGQKLVTVELTPVRDARLAVEAKAANAEAERKRKVMANVSENLRKGTSFYEAKDWASALPYMADACEGGSAIGCYKLAHLQMSATGGADWVKAETNLKNACNARIGDACYVLAHNFYSDNNDERSRLASLACSDDSMRGCAELASALYKQNTDSAYDAAIKYGEKACKAGIDDGCLIARMGISKMLDRADAYEYRKAQYPLEEAARGYTAAHKNDDPPKESPKIFPKSVNRVVLDDGY